MYSRHECPDCNRTWEHKREECAASTSYVLTCLDCSWFYQLPGPWWYVDEFDLWVEQVRKEAGL